MLQEILFYNKSTVHTLGSSTLSLIIFANISVAFLVKIQQTSRPRPRRGVVGTAAVGR